jgi:hypothetical protein
VPALLKHWFDVVLVEGWAYGEAHALRARTACGSDDGRRRAAFTAEAATRIRSSVRARSSRRALLRHELARALRGARRARSLRRASCASGRELARAARGARPMTEALIFLAAAVICVPIAARLGLGSVLGYLIAGARHRPVGPGLVGDVDSTQNLAELGVVLMLFVIGLELDPRRLAHAPHVFSGGALQLASAARCSAARSVARPPWQAALVGGLALALSSTAIAMQAMTERNELATPTGQRRSASCSSRTSRRSRSSRSCPSSATSRSRARIRCGCASASRSPAIAGVVVIGATSRGPRCAHRAHRHARALHRVRAALVIGIAELMSLAGCRWRWAPSSPACCSRARSSATRSRATSSPSRGCCWASSSSRSA